MFTSAEKNVGHQVKAGILYSKLGVVIMSVVV